MWGFFPFFFLCVPHVFMCFGTIYFLYASGYGVTLVVICHLKQSKIFWCENMQYAYKTHSWVIVG